MFVESNTGRGKLPLSKIEVRCEAIRAERCKGEMHGNLTVERLFELCE